MQGYVVISANSVSQQCQCVCDLITLSCGLPLFVRPLLLHHGTRCNRIKVSIICEGWSVSEGNRLPGISPALTSGFYATCQYRQTFEFNHHYCIVISIKADNIHVP
jgi:hypothetical protein